MIRMIAYTRIRRHVVNPPWQLSTREKRKRGISHVAKALLLGWPSPRFQIRFDIRHAGSQPSGLQELLNLTASFACIMQGPDSLGQFHVRLSSWFPSFDLKSRCVPEPRLDGLMVSLLEKPGSYQ